MIEAKSCDEKVDIYSLGVILLELCYFFETKSERHIVIDRLRRNGEIPEVVKEKFPQLALLIEELTDSNPDMRPSAYEIIRSESYCYLSDKYGNGYVD